MPHTGYVKISLTSFLVVDNYVALKILFLQIMLQ